MNWWIREEVSVRVTDSRHHCYTNGDYKDDDNCIIFEEDIEITAELIEADSNDTDSDATKDTEDTSKTVTTNKNQKSVTNKNGRSKRTANKEKAQRELALRQKQLHSLLQECSIRVQRITECELCGSELNAISGHSCRRRHNRTMTVSLREPL